MTTPAVDIKARKFGTGTERFISPSWPFPGYVTTSNPQIGYLYRKRGQSVSSPMTPGHFRFPTYWRHEGGFRPVSFQCTHTWGESYYSNLYYTEYSGGAATGPELSLGNYMIFPDNLVDRTINGLLLKIKGQKVNLSQAFAERQQTIDLVAGIADDIYRSILAFRKLKGAKWWSRFKKLVKKQRAENPAVPLSRYVTNLTSPSPSRSRKRRPRKGADLSDERVTQDWLAFQYGLLPALSDAYGIVDALNQREKSDSQFYRSYVKVKKGLLTNAEDEELYKCQVLYGNGIRMIYRVSVFHGCSAECQMTIENDLVANLGSLGVTNPAVLAWELLPFSFVADWFLPVGQYLNAMDATVGWRFLSGSVSKVSKLEGQFVGSKNTRWLPSFGPNQFYYAEIHELERGNSRLFWFERQVMSNFPGPRVPEFKNPITLGHFANASALLVQLFR